MTRPRAPSLVLLLAVLSAGCRHWIVPPESAVQGLSGATKIYTLTALHVDDRSGTLSSANLQYPLLVPVCSEVTILSAYPGALQFKVSATSQEYWYVDHRAGGAVPFDQQLAKVFGRACPQAELDALTPAEKEGVRLGVANRGMRKQAVILAMGYPPARDTRSLELPYWRYWSASNRYFTIVFDDAGAVEDIRY